VVSKQRKSSLVTALDGGQKVLSPRGRGSAVTVENPDRLLALFAENTRLVRTTQNLSQEELADLRDLDRTYISGIERISRKLGIRNIQRIADALKVDVRVLIRAAD
jgi:ribosome-binding protein aMBF1 (putative translation factor)